MGTNHERVVGRPQVEKEKMLAGFILFVVAVAAVIIFEPTGEEWKTWMWNFMIFCFCFAVYLFILANKYKDK